MCIQIVHVVLPLTVANDIELAPYKIYSDVPSICDPNIMAIGPGVY